ncbi:hypothetical protein SLE2022_192830 [Rubroshorea leprosula]
MTLMQNIQQSWHQELSGSSLSLFSSSIFLSQVHSEHKSPIPSRFFIRNLQGSHKGDKGNGILVLRNYLQRFGYLSSITMEQSSRHLFRMTILMMNWSLHSRLTNSFTILSQLGF